MRRNLLSSEERQAWEARQRLRLTNPRPDRASKAPQLDLMFATMTQEPSDCETCGRETSFCECEEPGATLPGLGE